MKTSIFNLYQAKNKSLETKATGKTTIYEEQYSERLFMVVMCLVQVPEKLRVTKIALSLLHLRS